MYGQTKKRSSVKKRTPPAVLSAKARESVGKKAQILQQQPRVPDFCPPRFGIEYTVKPGDTMWLIARRYNISVEGLATANPHIPDPGVLFPGDVLCVPEPPPPPPPIVPPRLPLFCPPGFQGRYSVRPGDTMYAIAQQYGVSLRMLIRANPHITNPNEIFPGDLLCVPAPLKPPG